jgi:DNA polymerase-4
MRKSSSGREGAAKPWSAARKIVHVDMDAFFAAIEQRDRPELRGRPVVVGGDPQGRGVVSTASYEARKFGIHSAMPAAQAKRLCPEAVFLRPDFEKYEAASHLIRGILRKYTDRIEPVSLDEAYLDVTVNTLRIEDPVELARLIKQNIKAATHLTASAGVAPNKFLAKIASDMKKPDGLFVVHPGEVEEFLAPLPVRKIPGVGPVTEAKLKGLGILTCGDLLGKSRGFLAEKFGKFGLDLYEMARGIDESPVVTGWRSKQVGCEETFERDLVDLAVMEREIERLADQAAERLRAEGFRGMTVTLKVKYADFTVITRAKTLQRPIEEAKAIAEEAITLLRNKTEAGKRKVRLLGVSVSHFEEPRPQAVQLDFLSTASPREQDLGSQGR